MREIRTDMGTEYKNQIFAKITELMKIEHKTSTAYHSQTIGGCERNHRVLNEYLRMYINDNHTDWEERIKYYAFCYNTTPSTYHSYTPFELVFGRKIPAPEEFTKNRLDPLYNIDSYEQELKYRLQVAHKRAREFLEKEKARRKQTHEDKVQPIDLHPGDLVMITNENRRKLEQVYKGPYSVVRSENANCVILNYKNTEEKVHKDTVQKYST